MCMCMWLALPSLQVRARVCLRQVFPTGLALDALRIIQTCIYMHAGNQIRGALGFAGAEK